MREFILPKKDRILKRKEFIGLKEHGFKIHDTYLIAVYKKNKLSNSRLGITVSSKVGGAVERNRLKRLIREAFRLNRNRLTEQIDMNIIAKRTANNISYECVSVSMTTLFRKAGNQIRNVH